MDFMARNIYLLLLKRPSNYHITKPNQTNTVLHGGWIKTFFVSSCCQEILNTIISSVRTFFSWLPNKTLILGNAKMELRLMCPQYSESKHTLHCSGQKNNVTIVTTSSLILTVDFVRICVCFVQFSWWNDVKVNFAIFSPICNLRKVYDLSKNRWNQSQDYF